MIDFKEQLNKPEYDFLKTNPHLGDNVVLLGLGGSYAYGTQKEDGTSDVDIRGIASNTKKELLTGEDFEQVVNTSTDTTIYSLNKMINLLTGCNPNVIEILGLKPEHYLYLNDVGRELLGNKILFLSKKAAASFGGYATAQLRRLDNKSARTLKEEEHQKHVLGSINNARMTFPEKFFYCDSDAIKLYVDKAVNPDMESEIFMDVNLTHYPLEDYKSMWNTMSNVVKDYKKIGKRNQHAIERGQLGKHQMHLIRLYLMCLDILKYGEINTYREKEHDFLMSIRNGKYLEGPEGTTPTKEFMDIVNDYEAQVAEALKNSELPDQPDIEKIRDLKYKLNEAVIGG